MNHKSFAPRGRLGAPVAPRKTWSGRVHSSTLWYAVYLYIRHVQLRKSLSGVLGKSDLPSSTEYGQD